MSGPAALPVPWTVRQQVHARCDWTCFYCGVEARWEHQANDMVGLTVDHVIPWARGGGNDAWNLVSACLSCNSAKGSAAPPEELVAWARELFEANPDPDVRPPMWRTDDPINPTRDFAVSGELVVLRRSLYERMENARACELTEIFSVIREEMDRG